MTKISASLRSTGALVCLFFLSACHTTGPAPAAANEIAVIAPIPRVELSPNDPDYLHTHLKQFGLTPLAETAPHLVTERYRFLWIRSFHPAALFEVEYTANGIGTYRASLWKDHRWVAQKTFQGADKKEFDGYRHMVAAYDMFHLPWWDSSGGLDGSEWFIELVRGDQHHEIYRWSPEEGPVRTFGETLIEAGVDSPFMPIY